MGQDAAVNLTDDELEAAFTSGILDDPKMLNKLDSDSRRRLTRFQTPARPDAVTGSPTLRFMSGVAESLNPVPFAQSLKSDPVQTLKNMGMAQVQQFQKAGQDFQQGHYSEMLGHGAAGLLPVLGPAAAQAGETIASGDVAGGLGQGAGLVGPFVAKPMLEGAARGAKYAPGASAVADALDRSAEKRLVGQMVPNVGANKVRFGNAAADAAPALLRDPDVSGFTRQGLHSSVEKQFASAGAELDQAADARLVSQQVKTGPLLHELDRQIAGLTASPVEGSKFVSQSGVNRPPIGVAVEPGPSAAQIATLKQIRGEIAQLGPVAPYEAIRRIRASWDQVARVKYLPSTAQDALKSQGDAAGAEKGTSAMRSALAQTDPNTAAANAKFSLYKSAKDVMDAAEETERVRPTVGRSIMASGMGAVAGAAAHGDATSMFIGAVSGPLIERAIAAGPTVQIAVAKRLAGVADLLRKGDVPQAQAVMQRTLKLVPSTVVKSAPRGANVAPLPMAAEDQPDEPPVQGQR